MSTCTNIADFPRKGDGPAATPEPANDRRKNERQIATFRTCCVVLDGEARPAILRNMSDGGAMFEALVTASPDTRLTYWWDGIEAVEARIAWVDGNRIGVANLSGPAASVEVPRPRATRVPIRLPVRIWSAARGRWAEVENISLSGLAVHGLADVAPGALCTIELGGQTLHNASVVRAEGNLAGIRFERPLSPAKLMQLLEGGGPAARVLTRPTPKEQIPQAQERVIEEAKRIEEDPHSAPSSAPVPIRRFL